MKIIEKRLKKIESLHLKSGSHSPNSTFCVMEAVAFVAGETWSDSPECACPVISVFLRSWNDALPSDEDRDRLLKPLVPLLVGTRNKTLEEKRALMAADWLIRVHTPAWLRLAGLTAQADTLSNLSEITSTAQFSSIRGAIEAVRIDAAAASSAAGYAAGYAARSAAWAAAGDAAGSAAGYAARSAARAAAWDAAGAAAGKKLAPTVAELQLSALELVKRMIALTTEYPDA